jgi:pilus assembly protein Flp/PilA
MEDNVRLKFQQFLADESGATAIEYGLIAAGIALAIITMVNTIGTTLNDKFTTINTKIQAQPGG